MVMVTGRPCCAPGTDPVIGAWGGLRVTPDTKQRCPQAQGRCLPRDQGGPDLPSRPVGLGVLRHLAVGCPPDFESLTPVVTWQSPPRRPLSLRMWLARRQVCLLACPASALCFSFLELFHEAMPATGRPQCTTQHCQARFWEPVKEERVSSPASRCSGSVFGPVTSLVCGTGLRITTCSPA